MISVAESFYDGTWGSGDLPLEIIDFEVMREMRWSWQDLQDTPLYVRHYVADLMAIRREAENREIEKAKANART